MRDFFSPFLSFLFQDFFFFSRGKKKQKREMKYNAHIKFSFFYLNNKNEIKKIKEPHNFIFPLFLKKNIKQHQHKKNNNNNRTKRDK